MKKLTLALIFLFLFFPGHSRQLSFQGYSIAEGLSQSVVNCLFQDSRGFLWIGTQNGLNRFDGFRFEVFTYQPDDTASLSNNWIFCIAEDRAGDIWVGTKGGLNRFLRMENRFSRIRYDTPYPVEVTRCIYGLQCSRDGRLLINTPPVLTLLDPETMEMRHETSPLAYDGSVKDCSIPLVEDREGRIWTGSTRGLACYHPADSSFRLFTAGLRTGKRLSHDNITALLQDSRGFMWVGSSSGLNRLDPVNDSIVSYLHQPGNSSSLRSSFIRALVEESPGSLWVATEGGGLNRFSQNSAGDAVCEAFTAGNSGLYHDILLSLLADRSGNLWIGTLAGINKADLKREKFRLYRKSDSPYSVDLTGNVIASLYKHRDGRIWVGTWGQGLDLLDRATGITEHYASNLPGIHQISNDFVHTIFEDRDTLIWIGTRDGLLVYEEETGRFLRPGSGPGPPGCPDFGGLRIFGMTQGRNGDYWIATQDGLFRIKAGSKEPERFHATAPPERRIGSNLVYGVLEDRRGFVWIATAEGLDCRNPHTGELIRYRKSEGEGNSLADNYIISLCEDHTGDIWIGTSSYVNRFSRKDSLFSYYSAGVGLPGNLVYSIVEDKSRGLWIATGNGLCRFDSLSGTFYAYTPEDGLQSQEFNFGAAFLSPDGELFFGGMNGFNSFYPDSLMRNPHIPPVVFTAAYKISKGERHAFNLEKSSRIVLKHNDHSLTVEFAALEFTNPSRNRYQYRLEGLEEEWISLGSRNFIPFSNLPPGEYRLRVKGSNNDGVWNEEGASLSIRVRPPWWGSRLAYLGYLLVALAAVWFFVRRRERLHLRARRLLEDKVRERTLLVESQKREILEKNAELKALNASKDRFFSIIAHDLRNPFHSIMGLSGLLLANLETADRGMMKKSLETILRASGQAHELLENLLLWARSQTGSLAFAPRETDMNSLVTESIALVAAQAAAKNIRIHTRTEGETRVMADGNMMMTVVRNLLTNALKFSFPGGEIRVILQGGKEQCRLSVKDNGTGIPAGKIAHLFRIDASHSTRGTEQEPGSGLGLLLCAEFVGKHGGSIEVESEEGKGSVFTVLLPSKADRQSLQ